MTADELRAEPYAYLLGLYLGDGYIARHPRTFRLRLALDSRYPDIVDAAATATREIAAPRTVNVIRHRGARCTEVRCYWNRWPELFPQHGPGPKHTRQIRLEDWQLAITLSQPQAFLRGLIHSDGCRCIATVRSGGREYRYARYYFSNRSEDIKELFCDHLDLLGIRWTRPNERMIQVARRAAVAALDEFVGAKH